MSEMIKLDTTIPESLNGLRLDQALAQIYSDYSRGQLSKWIKAGDVLLNQQSCRPKDSVHTGDIIEITAQPITHEDNWRAEAIALEIVHEDADILIINKPAGMVVHPGAGNQHGTLVNALLAHAPQLTQIPRAGIVHRIDKDTSGLLMVAKSLRAHHSLISQLQARTVIREYQAIAYGQFTAGGTIDAPIGRHHLDRKRMAVTSNGKHAVTHYRVEERFRAHTHICCKLETGRTHQIRVHMAHLRHPLLGDPVYGGRFKIPRGMTSACLQGLQNMHRQALHAGVLGFNHPATDEAVCWQIPMPNDMQRLLELLRMDAAIQNR